jgi:ribonuclease P protein subunit RPR2
MQTRDQKRIARERIQELFQEADKAFSNKNLGKDYSNRYVALARKIAMKYKVKIPSELKRRFCKHCYSFLVPGKNCSVRTHEGHVVYFCESCKKYMRYPYKNEQKAKRSKTQELKTL